jgi:DNA replication protein DnaC
VFTKTNAFLADLAGGRAEGNWQTRLRRYLTPDLVILDDFAMRGYTLTQAEDLYELVKGRYRRGSLILTSNREPKDLYELFPTPVMAEGLLDRLVNSAQQRVRHHHARKELPTTATTWHLNQRSIDQWWRPAAGKLS